MFKNRQLAKGQLVIKAACHTVQGICNRNEMKQHSEPMFSNLQRVLIPLVEQMCRAKENLNSLIIHLSRTAHTNTTIPPPTHPPTSNSFTDTHSHSLLTQTHTYTTSTEWQCSRLLYPQLHRPHTALLCYVCVQVTRTWVYKSQR